MTVTIPTSEAQYGYVVGRVIRALGDTTDADDKPDAVAAAGSMSFTPKAPLGRTTDYSAFIVREKITVPLDTQGNLVTYSGTVYRCLQAHTSQAGWTPTAVASLWAVA